MSMQNGIHATDINDTVDHAKDAVEDTKNTAMTTLADLKDQTAQATDHAKTALSDMASDAKAKVKDIVDKQKSAGADHISTLAKAAQTAAGELDERNPQVARLVRDAANSVDRFAGDLRDRDVRDVVAQVSAFARQQPVAFFAGSVLVGFVLARFLKSEAPSLQAPSRPYQA